MASPTTAASAYGAMQRLATAAAGSPPAPAQGAPSFADALGQVLGSVAESGRKADTQTAAMMQGKADMVDVVTAVAESETAISTLVAVRDRVIAAYEDIMRMPV
jgi:flagellar hook-basal body complex protein FliE